MKLFCYEIQLCKEFAEVCIFCGSFIINSFWTHLSYVLKTGRRLFWKNEAKVRKKAWVISSIMAKLEMPRISICKYEILLPFNMDFFAICLPSSKLHISIPNVKKESHLQIDNFCHVKVCHNRRNGFQCNTSFCSNDLTFYSITHEKAMCYLAFF